MTSVADYLKDLLPGLGAVDAKPAYRQLLDEPPLVSSDGMVVVFSRQEDCSAVLRHPLTSVEWKRSPLSPYQGVSGTTMLVTDPPEHTRLRRLVSKAFTRRAIDSIEAWFAAEVARRLDALVGRQSIEVVSEIALPLPVAAISEMLGIPEEHRDQFGEWSEVIGRNVDEMFYVLSPEDQRRRRHAFLNWRRYLTTLANERRESPREDLMTDLVRAEDEGGHLTNLELVRTVQLLFLAGHETTVSAIGSGAILLADRPEMRTRVAADPEYAQLFAEEVLRQFPPVPMVVRIALDDLEIGGAKVRAGAIMLVIFAAANLDPREYAEPDPFDPERTDQRHMAFGGGAHFCMGAPLARMEAREVLQAFAQRLVNPRVGAAGINYRSGLILRGYDALHLDVDEVLPSAPASA